MNKIGCVQHDCPECARRETFIADVRQFTEAVGCTTNRFNVRQTALYIGLQLEEMAEKLESIFKYSPTAVALHDLGMKFKEGEFDCRVEGSDRAAMLDADIDLAWVTIGSALSQGADVLGACGEVARANLDKLVECEACDGQGTHHRFDGEFMGGCPVCNETGRVAIKDANGKVTKPEGWRAPDITPFVCKGGAA